jgi:hypothetical protein
MESIKDGRAFPSATKRSRIPLRAARGRFAVTLWRTMFAMVPGWVRIWIAPDSILRKVQSLSIRRSMNSPMEQDAVNHLHKLGLAVGSMPSCQATRRRSRIAPTGLSQIMGSDVQHVIFCWMFFLGLMSPVRDSWWETRDRFTKVFRHGS